ncbi:uncharacterized protein LOC119075648 [Bradysia coprophila]|uniref:uncharacterized protein LOC119075648 n=1 Tax=Bradysia coprophila TaxID=38358 RepID=UPI00187DB69F|nr:uncharacterized protein LOC119075648 [Bradysia coprophila]
MTSFLWIIYVLAIGTAKCAETMVSCGGYLTATHGIIQTPNFPNKFHVPINCLWIIDGSASTKTNISIAVYFTQQYVLSGLKFTEYLYYTEDYKVPSQQSSFVWNEDAMTQVSWVQFQSPYLEIKFTMTNLHGTHIRSLNRLLDVYGFNITYEIDEVKPYRCSALQCHFSGNCYVKQDFSSYYCGCFDGFSGVDCGSGPLCKDEKSNFCENGGTCKQIGDASITCVCPSGFTGSKCEIYDFTEEEYDNDLVKYIVHYRLENILHHIDEKTLSKFFETNLIRALRAFNVTKINTIDVYRTTIASADITFQFFGAKNDGPKIRDVVQKLEERGRLDNVSFIPTMLEFHEEAALRLQSLFVNTMSPIREGDDFNLTCTAEGSSKLMFRWYKNKVLINVTKASSHRKIWQMDFPDRNAKDVYISHLAVTRASRFDKGVYTCQVIDSGMEQRRSIAINILSKPELRVDPPSVTIYRGESLHIKCVSADNDQTLLRLGYSWLKNNVLFQSDPDVQMWEDLYPDGSILKIYNIQKSANYTCISSNKVGKVSKSVYVSVVDIGAIELCSNDTIFGTYWPSSSPGSPIKGDCPKRFDGYSLRICEQKGFGKPVWLLPDFSNCVADFLVDVNNEFRGLTYGYQKTNGSAVLKSCLEYAMNRHADFLPGEAGFLLGLLQEIGEYLLEKGTYSEQEMANEITLQVLDILLKSEHSINKEMQVKQLQSLVQSAAVNRETITSPIPVPVPSTSLQFHQMSSFRMHRQYIRTLPFNSQIYGDHLFSDQFYIEIASTSNLQNIISNGTILLTVISYKNLTNYLPRMYFQRNGYEPNFDFKVASRIISSYLYHSNQTSQYFHPKPLKLTLDSAHVEIIFQHENAADSEWISICGYDLQATFTASWRTDLCVTESLMINVTRCVCPVSGTYAILLTKKNFNATITRISYHPMFVIVSCGCCFIQSCIAFAILLPILYSRKCSVTFLKMQFCTATSTSMAIFTLGLLRLLPQNWHGIISSSLAGLLLLGTSTLIGITLIIQSELDTRKSPKIHLTSGMRGVIGISWLLPILYAVALPLIYTVMGEWPKNWWLDVKSLGFILFVVIELLFVLLFCLLIFTLFQKLLYLAKKHDKHNASILKRIALIYRTAIILTVKLTTDTSYLIYLNSNEFILNYVFGISSIILGFSVLFCFVIKAEEKLQSETINKSTTKQCIEEYCSGSINSPISFYTSHDGEKENDGAPTKGTNMPLDMLNASHRNHVVGMTSGDICETGFAQSLDNPSSLDSNFRSFSVAAATSYEYDVQQRQYLDAYATNQESFNVDANGFAVINLDILQGLNKGEVKEHSKITFIESLPTIDINDAPPFNKTALVQHAIQPTQLAGTTNATPSPSKAKPSPPTITITEDDGDKSTNGMLDRISHDLDFLLNRTMEIPVRRANGNFQNQQNDQTDKSGMNPLPPPNLSVHEVILEECED